MFIGVEEVVVAQENRKGKSKFIEDGKGLVEGLDVTRAELR